MPATKEAEALRNAVVCGDFAGSKLAAQRFASLLAELAGNLPPAEAARQLQSGCELLEWSRRNLCAARARLAAELRRLDSLSQYHDCLAILTH